MTTVSSYLAEATEREFRPSAPIRVVPNFVDPRVYTPEHRSTALRSLYAAPGCMLVGHLSNFRQVKRVPDVVRSFHAIQKKVPSHLLLIGDGTEIESARHLVLELGISRHVTFLGPIPQVAEILAQLDLFLLPSESESFGLAALEAMACGVPVVSTRTGGIPEVVEHNVTGILCEVGDYTAMASAAISLLEDRARHAAMAAAARRRASESFPQDRIVTQYEAVYGEVVASRRASAGAAPPKGTQPARP